MVLPLALTAALALLQVGLLAKDALLAEQAAREGAREAAVSTDADRVREAALRGSSFSEERTEIDIDRVGTAGDPVTVRVRYRSPLVVPFVEWLFPAEVEVEADATMRQETDGVVPS
jgi:hypothetical protein